MWVVLLRNEKRTQAVAQWSEPNEKRESGGNRFGYAWPGERREKLPAEKRGESGTTLPELYVLQLFWRRQIASWCCRDKKARSAHRHNPPPCPA